MTDLFKTEESLSREIFLQQYILNRAGSSNSPGTSTVEIANKLYDEIKKVCKKAKEDKT